MMDWLIWKPRNGYQLLSKTNILSPSLDLNSKFRGRVKELRGRDIILASPNHLQIHRDFTSDLCTGHRYIESA